MKAASFMARAKSTSAMGEVTTKDTEAASDLERTGEETSITSEPTMCWNEKLQPSPYGIKGAPSLPRTAVPNSECNTGRRAGGTARKGGRRVFVAPNFTLRYNSLADHNAGGGAREYGGRFRIGEGVANDGVAGRCFVGGLSERGDKGVTATVDS